MKFPFVALVLLFLGGSAIAQAPKVIPPSPNAQAFREYKDVPVSAYTGSPDISIPLYEINAGDIKVPISVSYSPSGIRVDQEASRVGLGWVLNATGMITRTIVGYDDFQDGQLIQRYHNNVAGELMQYQSGYPNSTVNTLQERAVTVVSPCVPVLFGIEYPIGQYDSEPDQYSFSLPNGKSGKFILKRNKEVILEKGDLVEIKLINDVKWTVRTDDGFLFEFDVYEQYLENQLTNYHKTAWYLTRIVSPTNDEVLFTYTVLNTNHIKANGQISQTMGEYTVVQCPAPGYSESLDAGRLYTNVRLETINFAQGRVEFIHGGRDDLQNDQRVDRIEIEKLVSKAPDTYTLLKAFDFGYEYFEGTNETITYPAQTPFHTKRLKLKTLIEKSNAGQAGAEHKFEYEMENISGLPSKRSFSRDHWGYYNGRGNASLIPSFFKLASATPAQYLQGGMGDERDSDPRSMKMWSLKRLWYPTGGFTDFEMETHTFDITNSLAADGSYLRHNPEADNKAISLTYEGDVYNTFYPANFAAAQQNNLVIDLTNVANVTLNLNMFCRFNNTLTYCPTGNDEVKFQLVNESNTVVAESSVFASMSNAPFSAVCSGFDGGSSGTPAYNGISYSKTFYLGAGRYYLRLYIASSVTIFADVNPTFSFWQAKRTDFGGGLRVKRTRHYESATANPIVTRYEYDYYADTNFDGQPEKYSFGVRMVNPVYSYYNKASALPPGDGEYDGPPLMSYPCFALMRTSDPQLPLNSSIGAVGYSRVTVYQGENGENGKSIYLYHNNPDKVFNYSGSGMVINPVTATSVSHRTPANPTSPNVFNGLLKEQIDFKYVSPGVFDTVKVVVNTYEDAFVSQTAPDPTIWAIERRDSGLVDQNVCNDDDFLVYPAIRPRWVYQKTSEERIYDQFSSGRKVITKSTLHYNSSNFKMVRKDDAFNAKTRSTHYRYASSYAAQDCTPEMTALRAHTTFFADPLIESRVEETMGTEARLISNDVTMPAYFNGNTMILPRYQARLRVTTPPLASSVPWFVPNATLDTAAYKIEHYLSYEANGNISVIRKPNDSQTAYKWGYQNALPVSEVRNANPSLVFYTSFEDIGEGNSTIGDAKTGDRSRTGGYSKALTGLTAGTYVQSYWLKSAGTWALQTSEVTVSGSTYNINLSGQVDEVRFYPKGAQMTTYVHEPLVGIRQVIDPNNTLQTFEYDGFGRLRLIRDEAGNIVKQYSYNYRIK
jgi:YD repeat-containing protein